MSTASHTEVLPLNVPLDIYFRGSAHGMVATESAGPALLLAHHVTQHFRLRPWR